MPTREIPNAQCSINRILSSLPEAFRKIRDGLPFVQKVLQDARKKIDGQQLSNEESKATLAIIDPCHDKAKELKRIFDEVVEYTKDQDTGDWARIRAAYHKALRGIKAHRVKILMKDILEGLQKLALSQLFISVMQKHLKAIEKAIEELSNVEPSLANPEVENSGAIYGSQTVTEGAIAQQNNSQGDGNTFNSGNATTIDLPTANHAAFDFRANDHSALCHPDTWADLLHQIQAWLFSHEPRVSQFLRSAVGSNPAIATKALREQFEKLILQPLSQVHRGSRDSTIAIVIDALGKCECEDDVKLIIRLFSQAMDLASIHLRVFITSRPELPIRLGFKDIRGNYQDLALDDYNSQDFDDEQLSPNWPGEHIQTLVRMTTPLFIFAATICRFVADETWLDPMGQLVKVLNHQSGPGSDLDKLDLAYLPVLDQLVAGKTDRARNLLASEFQKIVGPIVLLPEPLSASSLSQLLSTPATSIARTLNLLHAVLDVPSRSDSLIRMDHLSFRDFLVDPDKRRTNPFWVDERATHEMIAARCLALLSGSGHLRKDICNLEMSGITRMDATIRVDNASAQNGTVRINVLKRSLESSARLTVV
ncbi:hypothetical protein B0T25DRAFT_565638 [Lasiosphaeria hispida]|uniref:NACHT-NTPase and P-loop NTPases N-terminal domain-containing protein n=1 Tax=Lasiosphaeria hispida TaxID=260671 RepID=A0AAJ0HSZ5_9PEZI|nr:hypothetical protein B0T25DRAFT_565638 [Lasiosphaeria hispida]